MTLVESKVVRTVCKMVALSVAWKVGEMVAQLDDRMVEKLGMTTVVLKVDSWGVLRVAKKADEMEQ